VKILGSKFKKLKQRKFVQEDIDMAIEILLMKDYLSDGRFAASRCIYQSSRGYSWLFIANELKQKCVCATIIQKLRESCEIDWYLQAELAYNKRFGEKCASDGNSINKLEKKQHREQKPRKFAFYNTAVIQLMKSCRY
jgi:regulatory protein